VSLKTTYNNAVIESLTVTKATQSASYHGENVIGGWTGKIMNQKGDAPASSTPSHAPGDAADADEWD